MATDLIRPPVGISFAIGILIASFGLAGAVGRTRSVGLAAAWHAAVKVLIGPAQSGVMLGALALLTWLGGRRRSAGRGRAPGEPM